MSSSEDNASDFHMEDSDDGSDFAPGLSVGGGGAGGAGKAKGKAAAGAGGGGGKAKAAGSVNGEKKGKGKVAATGAKAKAVSDPGHLFFAEQCVSAVKKRVSH